MKQIFELIGAILFSLGGGGVIVFALSSWLGKVWANRILEEEKQKHQLEIENYKSKLNSELNKINSLNEKALHITKTQYDKEFEIYQDIWEKLFDCIIATKNLYPAYDDVPLDEVQKLKWIDEKFELYANKFNSYQLTIDRCAPFYDENFYKSFIEVRDCCSKVGMIFKHYNYDVKYSATYALNRNATMTQEENNDVYINIPKVLEDKKSELQNQINMYLKNLQVFQG